MPRRLIGKIAIVTGASRGLGLLCAVAYALEGATVVVAGRSQRESALHMPGNIFLTEETIRELGGEAVAVPCDVSDRASVESLALQVLRRFGRVDILMNNAAFEPDETPATLPVRLFERTLDVNVLGPFYAIRAVLPAMKEQCQGNIINVSGRSAGGAVHLDAAKAALEALTVGFANELHGDGIAVNSLRPVGWIDTPGVLLNPAVHPRDVTPPHSYVESAVLLAMQTSTEYSGHVATDAEIIRDLSDEATLLHFASFNPPAWYAELHSTNGHHGVASRAH
jgi:NAD(P)-dependent dehydrogenase (short-subunit alcohol dehydrogenase family)